MRRLVLAALLMLALPAAGCGGESVEPTTGGAPAVTSEEAYELGGADGSGADGDEDPAPRGGIGAGPDSGQPGDRPGGDARFSPPRD